jgi:hypothetical protein
MTRDVVDESESDERDLERIERAMRAAGVTSASSSPKPVPLEYAQRRSEKPPFDWAGAFRQFVFAVGVGFIAGAFTDMQWQYAASRNGNEGWIGVGAALVTLALPWPGWIGRRRE